MDSIVANNPNFNTPEQVYGNMAFDISTTGNVHLGWSGNINPVSGVVNITNNNFSYTPWTSGSNSNTMTATLNLRNMLDYNANGMIDPNEVLIVDGIAQNAFTANFGLTGTVQADSSRFVVIPEPRTAALLAMAGAAFAFRRREQPTESYKND